MLFDGFRTDTFFGNEFDGWAEEVKEGFLFRVEEVTKKDDVLLRQCSVTPIYESVILF
jgi:hypothetical protein